MTDSVSADHWIRRLARYCLRYPRHVATAMGASVCGALVAIAIPLILRTVVDGVRADRDVAPVAILLLAAALANYGAAYLRRFHAGQLSLHVQHQLRKDIFDALSALDGARQDQISVGQVVTRTNSDVAVVQSFLGILPTQLGSLVMFVVSLAVMTVLSPALVTVSLCVVPGLWWAAARSRRMLFPATWVAQQNAGVVADVAVGAVAGARIVRIFGQERQEQAKFERAVRMLYAARMRSARLNARYTPALQFVPAAGQVATLAFGGWLAFRGDISVGTFLAFSSYLAQLVGPVSMLAGLLTSGQQTRASAIRVFEAIDARPGITEAPGARPLDVPPAPGVTLDEVWFGYVPSHPVLQGLSLEVRPGETLAVVGASGSGKSTIAMLLHRFYDVGSGAVRIGDTDIRDTTLDSLRSVVGIAMEETMLSPGSVRDNIAYGRPDAAEEQIVAAARVAGADAFISRLADGYATVIGENGVALSGGEQQRIALARAVITEPRVLVLDDAMSAVDAVTEAEIHAAFRRMARERTTIIIAHRRSTIALADRVAVMDAGRVVDVGTQAELMDRCALFRLLLAGPGADAEGIDAGELPNAADVSEQKLADGTTAQLWDEARAADQAMPGGGQDAVVQAGSTRGLGALGGAMLGMAATPEILERVARLPDAVDEPREVGERRAVGEGRDVGEGRAVGSVQAGVRAGKSPLTLAGMLRPVWGSLVVAVALVVLDTAASLSMPALIRSGVDGGVVRHDAGAIRSAALVGALVIVAGAFVQSRLVLVMGRLVEQTLYAMRTRVFAHLLGLSIDYYERENAGQVMTYLTADIDAVSGFLQSGLVQSLVSVTTVLGTVVVLLTLSPALGLTACSVLPVMVVATLVFRRRANRAYSQARDRAGAVTSRLQSGIAGLRVSQAFRQEKAERSEFAKRSDDYRVSRTRAQRYIALYFPFVQLLSTISITLVMLVGAGQVHDGTVSIGLLLAFMLYIEMLFSPIQQLSQAFDGYQQAKVGLARVRKLLAEQSSTPEPASVGTALSSPVSEIAFRDVQFRYGPDLEPVLTDINLRIRGGESVAFVGETGAGKTTLVNLVARLHDVSSGAILFNGVDIRQLPSTDLRRQITLVPQDGYLFPGTVRDNIAYGDPGSTNAAVEAAARATGAHAAVARLAGGYHHRVTAGGQNLSAGQRQLLALARAELTNPSVIILDEATANLDLASEAAFVAAAEGADASRTTLVVAHRLDTAARADRIVVLDRGRVVEVGVHAELIRAGGPYARMWESYRHGVAEEATDDLLPNAVSAQ